MESELFENVRNIQELFKKLNGKMNNFRVDSKDDMINRITELGLEEDIELVPFMKDHEFNLILIDTTWGSSNINTLKCEFEYKGETPVLNGILEMSILGVRIDGEIPKSEIIEKLNDHDYTYLDEELGGYGYLRHQERLIEKLENYIELFN